MRTICPWQSAQYIFTTWRVANCNLGHKQAGDLIYIYTYMFWGIYKYITNVEGVKFQPPVLVLVVKELRGTNFRPLEDLGEYMCE